MERRASPPVRDTCPWPNSACAPICDL